jgi:hypothetical protein
MVFIDQKQIADARSGVISVRRQTRTDGCVRHYFDPIKVTVYNCRRANRESAKDCLRRARF